MKRPPATLALHLGAHKTGTSHLQAALSLNAASLAAVGALAPPLTEIRREATRLLGAEPDGARAWLLGLARTDAARIVISDENLPGRLAAVARGGRLYPALARRLAPFAEWPGPVEVHLTLRSYETFWPAIWLETLLHRAAAPWAAFAAGVAPERARWPELVSRIERRFPGAQMVLWAYEGYREGWRDRFQRLTGGAVATLAPPETVRPSLPAPAAEELDRLAASEPDRVRARARALRRAAPAGPPFRPFAEAEARRLASLYAADLETLAARHPALHGAACAAKDRASLP